MEGIELRSRKTQFLTGLNDHLAVGELGRKGIILEGGIVDGNLIRILIFLGGERDRREILNAPGKNVSFGYVPRAEQEIIGALFRLYKRDDHRIAFFGCKLRAPLHLDTARRPVRCETDARAVFALQERERVIRILRKFYVIAPGTGYCNGERAVRIGEDERRGHNDKSPEFILNNLDKQRFESFCLHGDRG